MLNTCNVHLPARKERFVSTWRQAPILLLSFRGSRTGTCRRDAGFGAHTEFSTKARVPPRKRRTFVVRSSGVQNRPVKAAGRALDLENSYRDGPVCHGHVRHNGRPSSEVSRGFNRV